MTSPNAEDGNACVRVTDSASVMLDKINRYLEMAPDIIFPRIAEVARRYQSMTLTRKDRDMMAVLYGINMHIGEMEAELLMPEELIGNDPKRRLLRKKINETLVRRPHANAQPNPYGCTHADLPRLRNEVIGCEEFTDLVGDLPSYQALLQANARVERLIVECEALAARRCARRCGTAAPLKQCGACEKFYCSSACLDAHTELNMCDKRL